MKAMKALIVVDAQNEFSPEGHRPVPNHAAALAAIRERVEEARREARPIAWVVHHNRPHEWPAFAPGSWGAELSPGLGPQPGTGPEGLFEKDVFGAFSGTALETWLQSLGVRAVLIVGFYTHMCVSTTTREALMRGYDVEIDPEATGTRDLDDERLGRQTADEVRRSALLHLTNMGAVLAPRVSVAVAAVAAVADTAAP
ncbi:MAG TPA: isochorismatase family cysteine hydrolase [Thermoanaerobaculia bacterium]|jgi:nicotinamidase-related amidase|nr:isochorismatase family cysteine hydrolase [Thermoanaerobaculia bacterium]